MLLVLVVLLRRSLLADKGHEIRKILVMGVVAVLMVLVVFLTSVIR